MNIYVGNLSFDLTEDILRQEFSAFGEVDSVSIIRDKFTGKSKGFGFVEMRNDTQAQAAIDALNQKELMGRAINVSKAKPRNENRDRRGGGFGRRQGSRW